MTSYSSSARRPPESSSGAFWMFAAVLLGLTLAVVGFFALMMWADARDARDDAAQPAAAEPAAATHAHAAADHNTALPLASFAGVVPENAAELAEAHKAYDAAMPPIPAGDLAKVHMTLKDMTVEIAPGVKYNTWAFDGHGAPGPVVHVREGQTVEMTLTNARLDPALDRLPRRPDRTERRFQGRHARRVDQVPLHRERSRCLHVPLRHQAGAGAHRERDVRRDRRPAEGRRCRRSTTSTCSSAASGT